MKKVFIEGLSSSRSIGLMFTEVGWEVVKKDTEADLICFSGGPDVSSMIYDCPSHPKTSSHPLRDETCFELWWKNMFQKPMVGICRGAQFLNVVNGGEMWQHVDSHTLGGGQTHLAKMEKTGELIQVTSTHHQMMIPDKDEGEILVSALISKEREFYNAETTKYKVSFPDIEGVWYASTNVLCYQPHPEYVEAKHKCQTTFFELIDDYLY